MRPRFFLDLDGVLADFDNSFPAVFGVDHRTIDDAAVWAFINGHPSFFLDLPTMPGALDFFECVRGWRPIILTACPKGAYEAAAVQKRAWVRKHLGHHVTVLPVMGGGFKPLFMHAPGDVLVDDYRRNVEQWNAAGGVGIIHRNFCDTFDKLREAMR